MKALILAGILAAGSVHGQSNTVIPPDARIYIDADQGFNVLLTATLEKRHVPLFVTTDKSRADFALQGLAGRDPGSGDAGHCPQTASDECAKHLSAAMQKKPQLADNAIKATAKKLQGGPSGDRALDF